MGGKLKVLAPVAVLGFVGGALIDLMGRRLLPVLIELLPELTRLEWVISGFVGSIVSVLVVTSWAYLTKVKE